MHLRFIFIFKYYLFKVLNNRIHIMSLPFKCNWYLPVTTFARLFYCPRLFTVIPCVKVGLSALPVITALVPRYGCILILILIPCWYWTLPSVLSLSNGPLVFTSTILRDAITLLPHSPPLNRTVDTGCLQTPVSLSLFTSSSSSPLKRVCLLALPALQPDWVTERLAQAYAPGARVISHLLPRALPLFNDTEGDLGKY